MADLQSIVDRLSQLTVIEAAELSKMLEERWGVSAAVPVAVPTGPAQTTTTPEAEQTEFDVVLVSYPADKKIAVIKEVRTITGLGLKEAKDLVEAVPKPLKEAVSKADAEKFRQQVAAAGGQVEVK